LDSATFVFIITRSVSEGPGYDQSLADASDYKDAASMSKVALPKQVPVKKMQVA